MVGDTLYVLQGAGLVSFDLKPLLRGTSEFPSYLTSEGDLFTGDTILGEGTTAIFPPDGNMADYIRSLQRLRIRNPRRIFPGHGPTPVTKAEMRKTREMWLTINQRLDEIAGAYVMQQVAEEMASERIVAKILDDAAAIGVRSRIEELLGRDTRKARDQHLADRAVPERVDVGLVGQHGICRSRAGHT